MMNHLENRVKVDEHLGINICKFCSIYIIELLDGSFKAVNSVESAKRVIEDFKLYEPT